MRTGTNKAHSHTLAEVVAALKGKAATDHTHPDLEARIAALEAAPPVEPPVEPTPYPVDDLVAAIAATPNGGTLDCGGAAFAAPAGGFDLNRSIVLRNAFLADYVTSGSATTATLRATADGAVVDNVRVRGGFVGILLRADDVVVQECAVRDVVYAGILTLSVHDCLVIDNLVDGVRPVGNANGWNAYGITATNLSGEPISERIIIRGNTVRNIPTWHGIDTHGGADIHVLDNTIEACRRGIFLTDSPARAVCDGNVLTCPTAAEQEQTPPGGAPATYLTDVRGISVVGGSGSITNNTGHGYPESRWWNPITPGAYIFSGNDPVIP